tara:strand:- start:94 stop:831 length:738 start_codon:yes stop_codon:yes gene_type:complete
MGQSDEAIDEINLALQANPRDAESLAYRALINRRQGDIDAAERDCRKALEINPDSIQAHGEAALIALENQDYDTVVTESTFVIDSNEDDNEPLLADAYNWRAQAHLMLGDASQAMSDINMAIKTWPDNSSAYCGLRSDISMANNSPSDAIGDIDIALAREPRNPDLLFRKGRILGALGQYEEAVHYISDAIDERPRFEEAILTRAAAYIHLGQNDRARADIDTVLEINPRSDRALTLRRQLGSDG